MCILPVFAYIYVCAKVPSTGGVSVCEPDGYWLKIYRGWGVLI
jgi:hypothetical protein